MTTARTLRAHRTPLALVTAAMSLLSTLCELHALPFEVETTTRYSRKVVSQGPAPFYERTYSALTEDSQDLTFQEFKYSGSGGKQFTEPRFIAFATRDGSIDDFFASPRECSSAHQHVYWVDIFSGLPVCLSYDDFGAVQGENFGDSFNPKIGGPAGDEGRYVIFQTSLDPHGSEVPNLWRSKIPALGTTQIVVHDRKWEETWLSASKCDEGFMGADNDLTLWDLSEDGKKIIFTSAASNLPDNLEPVCRDDSPTVADAFIRDGATCRENDIGGCKTDVLFDTYELHAGENTINLLNGNAENLHVNEDATVAVFDTVATTPIHFKPDLLGFRDIYYHKAGKFTRVSGAALLPRCSAGGDLLPITTSEDPADNDSITPRVDGSGRYVVFASKATNLVINEQDPDMVCKETIGNDEQLYFPHPKSFSFVETGGNQQIYIYDNVKKTVTLISHADGGVEGADGDSSNPWISKDAHYIVFESQARNLLNTQTSAARNIFMYDRIQEKTFLVTPGADGSGLSDDASITHVGPSGLAIAFQTRAADAALANEENGGAVDGIVQHVYLAQHGCPLDSDGDTSPDCLDLCKFDPDKTEPGQCGCGSKEDDEDEDGTADCVDLCDEDPDKQAPGSCGCGVSDADGDGDGTADCIDVCPQDPNKTTSAGCGCGISEGDSDGDGASDCSDQCPNDPTKIIPGECGCGNSDDDDNGNGNPDCNDPNSNLQPTEPEIHITRIRSGGRTTYQVLAKLQGFTVPVNYRVTLKGARTRSQKTVTKTKRVVGFSRLRPDRYTLTYSVRLGSIATKQTSVTFDVPKKSQTSSASRRK